MRPIRVPIPILPVAIFALLVAAPSIARAACDCASSGAAPYCTGSEVSYTSKFGSTLTVRFGARDGNSSYVCGQYANGDFWVLGKGSPRAVVVASTSPARTGSGDSLRNGFAVDPKTNVNSYDGRVIGSQDPPGLPLTLATGADPVSFVTSMSATSSDNAVSNHPCQDDATNSRACRQFQHVVTFLDATPTNSSDLFRPGFAGPRKVGTGFRVSQIASRLASLPSLDPVSSVSTWSLQHTADRFRWLHPYNSDGCGSNRSQWAGQEAPRDNFRPSLGSQTTNYGGSISLTNAAAILRLFVKDFDRSIPRGSVSRAAALGLVQVGIDTFSAMLNGATTYGEKLCLDAHGSIFVGRKIAPVFAAWALDDSAMRSFVAEGTHFHEDDWAYYGADGVALQGFAPPYATCDDRPDNCTMGGDLANWCRPGVRQWDAMCCNTKNYPSANSNSAPWNALVVKLLGVESIWNDPAYLDFAWRWREGRHRDGSANVGPKMYCGPSNHMGNDGDTMSTAQMSSFPADMWDRYKDLTSTGVTPPVPVALPPPTQLEP